MKVLLATILAILLPSAAWAAHYELTVVSLCDGQKTYATYKERSLVRARYWQAIFRKDTKYIATWIKRVK
jgi:hypothetical protein